MLNNKVLRLVASHITRLDQMTPDQLSLFAMIYTSNEMLSAESIDRANLDTLAKAL